MGVALVHAGRGVAEDLLHLAQEKGAAVHLGRRRVAQVVEADVLELRGLSHRLPEAVGMSPRSTGDARSARSAARQCAFRVNTWALFNRFRPFSGLK
jgi:hypothetical protein